jgi:hypothetical protein
MARIPATQLEGDAFDQALAVLERAQPSPRQDLLFRLLNAAVWGAVILTALYLLFRVSGSSRGALTVWIARAIAFVYIAIVPLFVANWRLVAKLWRAARFRRTLQPSFRRRLAERFKIQRRKRRWINVVTLLLSAGGSVLAAAAFLGILLETIPGDPNSSRVALYAVLMVFGMSFVFLHFIARGRERLRVIAELRQTVLATRDPATDRTLSPEEYDEITRIEQGQISVDRKRSAKAASGRSLEETWGSKEHRDVRAAKLRLSADTLVRVQASIDRLTRRPEDVIATRRDGVLYLQIPETSLVIGFTVDRAAREIRLLSLSTTVDGRSSETERSEAR